QGNHRAVAIHRLMSWLVTVAGRNLPLRNGHAMLARPVNNNEGRVTHWVCRSPKIRQSTGMLAPGMLAELNQMKFRHALGLICAVLISAALAGTASAQ